MEMDDQTVAIYDLLMDTHITIIRERLLYSRGQMNTVTEESQFQGCVSSELFLNSD